MKPQETQTPPCRPHCGVENSLAPQNQTTPPTPSPTTTAAPPTQPRALPAPFSGDPPVGTTAGPDAVVSCASGTLAVGSGPGVTCTWPSEYSDTGGGRLPDGRGPGVTWTCPSEYSDAGGGVPTAAEQGVVWPWT